MRYCILALTAVLAAVPKPAHSAADAAKGKEVFQQCAVCHNADSEAKKVGPGLKGVFKRSKFTSGKQTAEVKIRAKIDKGGGGMPAYKDVLSDPEKDDLIAYLKTL